MSLEEVLKLEIEQEYEQFRWIAQQQRIAFNTYSVMVGAPFLVFGLFAKEGDVALLLPWLPLPLVILGIIGIAVARALIGSRVMQNRISGYILELIIQLTQLSQQSSPVITPAIRFRGLRTSGGQFLARDTGNITVSLIFVLGLSLIIIGTALFSAQIICVPLRLVIPLGVIVFAASSYFGVFGWLKNSLDTQMKTVRADHREIRDSKEPWDQELRRRYMGFD